MRPSLSLYRSKTCYKSISPPIVRISCATFYPHNPRDVKSDVANPGYFPNLSFDLPSNTSRRQIWALICQKSNIRNVFFNILRGHYYADPESGRSYPYLCTEDITLRNPKSRLPANALQYVGFTPEANTTGSQDIRGSYLGERYEGWGRKTGISLIDYLTSNTGLDSIEDSREKLGNDKLRDVLQSLKLDELGDLSLKTLSNGQFRRARIAKALLQDSEFTLLDSPFEGLDPLNKAVLSDTLRKLALSRAHRIFLAVKHPHDVPSWVSHLIYAQSNSKVVGLGPRSAVLQKLRDTWRANPEEYLYTIPSMEAFRRSTPWGPRAVVNEPKFEKRAVVEMRGVQIRHGNQIVVGNWKQDVNGRDQDGLWWRIETGERWGLFGPNGSGKSTILSVISSEHPQSYAVPLQIFGRDRLPSKGLPGISYFEIQSRVGFSSPELLYSFPKHLSVRRTIESAWADSPLSRPLLVYEDDLKVDACLRWFQSELSRQTQVNGPPHQNSWKMLPEEEQQAVTARVEAEAYPDITSALDWADETILSDLPISSQKVALFLRAVIRTPDLLLLDEAFSGMDADLRDKCLIFLEFGQKKVLKMVEIRGKLNLRLYSTGFLEKEQMQVKGLQPHQTLIAASHEAEDIPLCVRDWICLPRSGLGPPRFGRFAKSIRRNVTVFNKILDAEGSVSSDDKVADDDGNPEEGGDNGL